MSMPLGAWVNSPGSLVTFRPGAKLAFLGDSITAGQGGWFREIVNHLTMAYGAAPTYTNRGTPGTTIANMIADGQVAAVIADAADIVVVECGVNNITGGVNRASIAADVTSVVNALRAGLSSAEICWLNVWCGHSEQWGPDPNQAALDAVNGGISDACATLGVQYVDVHSFQQADEMTNNAPAPGASSGINTVDGTHPNWRGRPLMGRSALARLRVTGASQVDVDVTPSWRPDADVVPSLWLDADQLSSGPVASWGGFSAAGVARPTCVANGWWNGTACVQFDGIANVMTSPLVTAAGPKTIFAVYKLRSDAPGFGNYYSLLTLCNGTVSSEFIPSYTGGTNPAIVWCCDQKAAGTDGFFETGTSDVSDGSGDLFPVRFGATFSGGSSTDTTQYVPCWGGWPITSIRGTTFLAQPATCLCALGARVADGVTATHFAAVDLKVLLVYPALLTPVQFYRVDQFYRRTVGP